VTQLGQEFRSGFFVDAEDADIVITHGHGNGRIQFRIKDDRLFVLVQGEPEGKSLIACVQQGLESGYMRPDMRTLVDFTRFTGPIEWDAVFTVRKMADWGKITPDQSRIAYLVPNDTFGMVLKVVRVLFFNSRHQIFTTPDKAVAWLESNAPE
jgi:hypothetical protein